MHGGSRAVVSAAADHRGAPGGGMSIGEVLAILRPEFPDVTISKLRFLEDQGLVEPERTPSGYRKFTHNDVERLRFVLSRQRDHYLPLRVIREYLEARDQGLEPPPLPGGPVWTPRLVGSLTPSGPETPVRFTREQLLTAAGVAEEFFAALEMHGLIPAQATPDVYDGHAFAVASAAAALARFGLEPRHLRAFRAAADREAGLVEQVAAPLRHQRGADAAARAEDVSREVATLCLRLHAVLVAAALNSGRG